jgi:hypothetical protein
MFMTIQPTSIHSNYNNTLNARYFCELFSGDYDFSTILPFPQRIPKTTFFEELFAIQLPDNKKQILELINHVSQQITEILDNTDHKLHNDRYVQCRELINYLNVLLRHGQSYDFEILSQKLYPYITADERCEFELLRITANINNDLSCNAPVDITELQQLTNIVLNASEYTDRMKILIGNRLVVSAYRYSQDWQPRLYAQQIYPYLLSLIDKQPKSFLNDLYASVMYRGLAMITELEESQQEDFLLKAETIARNIKPTNPLENIVAKENLYTLLQTLAKWSEQQGNMLKTKDHLQEMLALDLYDSTGYSQYGFFLFDQQKFQEASIYFKLAYFLGSPAVAMNLYYYAQSLSCLPNIDQQEIIKILYEVTTIDPDAISPLLDLFEYEKTANNQNNMQAIANKILSNNNLSEQLTTEEYEAINTILESKN